VVQPKYYPGSGVITELRKNTGEVELDHEEIKGKMPAMKMMFHVKEKEFLQNLKVGDKVSFVLEDDAGFEQLSSIVKK
jgi:Cu/Ag efflux protein CusF